MTCKYCKSDSKDKETCQTCEELIGALHSLAAYPYPRTQSVKYWEDKINSITNL